MGYPIFSRQVDRLIESEALHTLTAHEMARKAGFRQTEGPVTVLGGPMTVIDAYYHPSEGPYRRQYLADFTEVSRVRVSSQSSSPIYIFYSPSVGAGPLDNSDFVPLVDDLGIEISAWRTHSDPGDDLRWFDLDPGERIPLRLTLSTSDIAVEIDEGLLDGAFSIALQAD